MVDTFEVNMEKTVLGVVSIWPFLAASIMSNSNIVSLNDKDQNITTNFEKILLNHNDLFVDKSHFIEEFMFSNFPVHLITRPRRWGKSMNAEMLALFLGIEIDNKGERLPYGERLHQIYFQGGTLKFTNERGNKTVTLPPLKISKNRHAMMFLLGNLPVLYISFQNVVGDYATVRNCTVMKIDEIIHKNNYERFLKSYCGHDSNKSRQILMTDEQCIHFLSSPQEAMKDDIILGHSLATLMQLLHIHFDKQVVCIVDEYDSALNFAFNYLNLEQKEIDRITFLFSDILTQVFKDNIAHLRKGLLTGVDRIAKSDVFAGLHYVRDDSVLTASFCDAYGFTSKEVDALVARNPIKNKTPAEVKKILERFYDGYHYGNVKIFNAFSIYNYFITNGRVDEYWIRSEPGVNSESGNFMKMMLNDKNQADVQELMCKDKIKAILDKSISVDNLYYNLILLGYVDAVPSNETTYSYYLRIPNEELRKYFIKKTLSWTKKKLQLDEYRPVRDMIVENLRNGTIQKFAQQIENLLQENVKKLQLNDHNFCNVMFGIMIFAKYGSWDVHRTFKKGFHLCTITLIPPETQNQNPIPIFVMSLKKHPLVLKREEEMKQVVNNTLTILSGEGKKLENIGKGIDFMVFWVRNYKSPWMKVIQKYCLSDQQFNSSELVPPVDVIENE